LPDYDEDRVYASDIKKVLNWYNMLQAKKGLVSKEAPEAKKQPIKNPSCRHAGQNCKTADDAPKAAPKKQHRKPKKKGIVPVPIVF
jgi:hypothetical protein